MISLAACVTGFILDMIFGDPRWLYHPVRLIGHLIQVLEQGLRHITKKSKKGQVAAGFVMWIIVVVISAGIPFWVLYEAEKISPWFYYGIASFWCYQLIAAKSLKQESMKVCEELEKKDLAGARQAVAMIVGRDTKELSDTGIIKAAVETVAENTTDGVVAPLFYMLIGGVPLAFFYKAVNTMDSMVGYKNDTYLYFGRIPAQLDDVFSFIPARIAAYGMMAASYFLKLDWRNAYRVYQRDRFNHASPNAAQTESVCAGALGIQLAGDAYYFGQLYKKETIGDNVHMVVSEDIKRVNQLMYRTAWISIFILSIMKVIIQI
ncbi:MAG: adenosylcobinamide-phosphate synthase CbiB [Lachnospiraceae bacterium]